MSARGRERVRKEEKGRGSGNPPSRHLWVGNLPHGISERELTDRFLRFGELESVAFQPRRSYAFLNFRHDEDAFAAIESLQGFPLAGNPLRIEFAKADKPSTLSHTEDQFHQDEQRSAARGSPFMQKDSRMRYESPDSFSKSKMSDKDAEPSEVLWIGFPASLKVDEVILRKAFSPFGEIEKVTVFPGRSYAFVRFRSLIAACKAKETLQGKLFGNPRVHICFAKSEPSSSTSGRGPSIGSLSPPHGFDQRLEYSECYIQGRSYGTRSRDPSVRAPHFTADIDSGGPDDYIFNRKGTSRNDGNIAYENVPYEKLRSGHRVPQDMHEFRSSPRERGSAFHDGPHRFPSRSSVYEEPWDIPEDDYSYQETKRLKMGSVPAEKELPEYPLSGIERERRVFSRASTDLSPPDAFERSFEAGPLRYQRMSEQPLNPAVNHGARNGLGAPYDDVQMGAHSLSSNVIERKRYTPEPERPSLKDWKWEGTIAKGGNPICRARCFPVGKVMDMMLPEFLDCTARTGLDMLAKHYYQASNAWVVFFVPGSDTDIGFYNEFMHYLEEKQRAAVSKLDDRTTLFLVPPSDFSEKVLKVPGKLSISGVVLRLEYPASGSAPVQPPSETSYPKASGAFPDLDRPGSNEMPFIGNQRILAPSASLRSSALGFGDVPLDPYIESRHEQPLRQHSGSNWPHHDLQLSASRTRSPQPQVSSSRIDHTLQGHHVIMPGQLPDAGLSHYPETKPPVPASAQLSGLQPEQIAQLASSLFGQQKQVGNPPNQPERFALHSSQVTPELSVSPFSQVQQVHRQQPSIPPSVQTEVQSVAPGNQNLQGSGTQEETEADPQKRLQATLHLAAALLQQIQQSKGT